MTHMDTTTPTQRGARGRNRRGQGELLREEIIAAALRLLDELADDQALSLRAVAREIGIAATSVYIQFADRDLVLAAMERRHRDLINSIDPGRSRVRGRGGHAARTGAAAGWVG